MSGLDSLATYVSLLKTSLIYISQFFGFGLPTNPVGFFAEYLTILRRLVKINV
jgi:hypothetical protein